ncbi:Conserved serine-threonine rich protein [Lasiodiplodia theobromae]|uniref:Conserved serine-threonine rich protein n=1 Tax=Lasiodiplodia theobromae TaxID=45133 RepID=UPI0015C2F355|nr:Conserved serine-threonine rich protein [Lasiodiplodia theobromae]KAF4546435.1 Conserved serine-threonine rich protein [Lasiodiplodia theobromae]
MLAHSINRGVSKHAMPRAQLPSVVSRGVSNWGRRRWPRWRDEADQEWKQFQVKMDAFHKQIEADPYEAIFGRSNEMLRGILRSPPADDAPKKTVPISTESKAQEPSSAVEHQPTVELSYDPITGRMVPKYGAFDAPLAEDSSIHYSQSHHDPRDDSLSAYDKKNTNTSAHSNGWVPQEDFTQTSASKSNTTEHDHLQESLAKYDRHMREQPQKPPAPPSEWLVQEVHYESPPSTLNRLELQIKTGQAMTRSIATYARGVQTASQDLSQEFDEILTGVMKRVEAKRIFERRQRLAEQFAKAMAEEAPVETSLPRAARKSFDDGYSQAPTGLQTSFEREKASGRDLAAEIQTRTNPVQYDDGYSHKPMGLQTSFEMEQAAGRSLAEDIQAKTEPQNYIVDDGYSREPMGLETSFEREKTSGYSLADEISAKTSPEQYIIDDGYSREPTGLETSYQRELDSGRSLEQEIQARDNAHLASPDDGYSLDPTGLQSSYARELEAVRNGEKISLEKQLSEMSLGAATYSDICTPKAPDSSISYSASKSATAPPRSVEQRRKQGAAPDEVKDWYGYSLKPLGLQTSYEREVEACQKGQRKSLEEELQEQALGAARVASDFDGQGFSRKPTGLETSFQRELDACANGKRKSLEEELAIPVDGGAVETMSTKEEAAKVEAAREQRLHDIALVREVREIYEKYYGKITTTHRQAEEASLEPKAFEDWRVDEDVHKSLSSYDEKHSDAYHFKPDNLEAELSSPDSSSPQPSQESTSESSAAEQPSGISAADASGQTHVANANSKETDPAATNSAKPRIYKLLAFDPSTRSLTTSQTSSTVHSPGEHPIPLSVALSNLSQPAKFIPQLTSLQKDGYEPVVSAANLLILRLRDDKSVKETHKRAPRPNPVDGTTIPLPPTPTMSPTGYINLDPVMENPATARKSSTRHKDDKKVRKTEPVFSGERRREGSKGQSVKTVLTTLIWATAACYVAGVAGEVAKGY